MNDRLSAGKPPAEARCRLTALLMGQVNLRADRATPILPANLNSE